MEPIGQQPTPREAAVALIAAMGEGKDAAESVAGMLRDILEVTDDKEQFLGNLMVMLAGYASGLADLVVQKYDGTVTKADVLDAVTVVEMPEL